MKYTLETKLYDAFSTISFETARMKAAYMGACSEIDRNFRSKYNIDLFNYVEKKDFINASYDFPNIADLSIDEFNDFISIYSSIRNVCAHLFLNIPIYVSIDLQKHFDKVCKPLFQIVADDNQITLFGAFYILSLLSIKEPIWEFCIQLFKPEYFEKIGYGKAKSDFVFKIDHWVIENVCGNGMPSYPSDVDKQLYKILNDFYKASMINMFFDFERCLSNRKKTSDNVEPLRTLLNRNPYISRKEALIEEIANLRNIWFHGYFLFDKQIVNGSEIFLDLIYILKLLKSIQQEISFLPTFKLVDNDISTFGKKIINSFILRSVELSYKLIDNRLTSEDKIASRVYKMNSSVKRILSCDYNYCDNALNLIKNHRHEFYVNHNKFTDFVQRAPLYTKLEFYYIESTETILIDNYDTLQKELYILNIKLDKEFQNKINGKYLSEYEREDKIFECDTYVIYKVK